MVTYLPLRIKIQSLDKKSDGKISITMVAQEPTGILHAATAEFLTRDFQSLAFVLNNCDGQISSDMLLQHLNLSTVYDPMSSFQSCLLRNSQSIIVFDNCELASDLADKLQSRDYMSSLESLLNN